MPLYTYACASATECRRTAHVDPTPGVNAFRILLDMGVGIMCISLEPFGNPRMRMAFQASAEEEPRRSSLAEQSLAEQSRKLQYTCFFFAWVGGFGSMGLGFEMENEGCAGIPDEGVQGIDPLREVGQDSVLYRPRWPK